MQTQKEKNGEQIFIGRKNKRDGAVEAKWRQTVMQQVSKIS